jgi:hypothetical protein
LGSASFRPRQESRTFWGEGLERPSHRQKVQKESARQEGGQKKVQDYDQKDEKGQGEKDRHGHKGQGNKEKSHEEICGQEARQTQSCQSVTDPAIRGTGISRRIAIPLTRRLSIHFAGRSLQQPPSIRVSLLNNCIRSRASGSAGILVINP